MSGSGPSTLSWVLQCSFIVSATRPRWRSRVKGMVVVGESNDVVLFNYGRCHWLKCPRPGGQWQPRLVVRRLP